MVHISRPKCNEIARKTCNDRPITMKWIQPILFALESTFFAANLTASGDARPMPMLETEANLSRPRTKNMPRGLSGSSG